MLIWGWFKRILDIKIQYRILNNNTQNFNKTGFQIGVIATIRVVTRTNRAGQPRIIQPGNREWVTIIKCINAMGGAIPPLVIFKAVIHQATWYKDNIIPHNQLIGVSKNGWIINKISLTQLNLFYKHIKNRTVGTHQMLVLNGHSSHVNPKFNQFCLDHKIIIICILVYLLYLLQPLDIGCFLALKQAYRCSIKQLIVRGVNHINKHKFLLLYRQARQTALH